MDSLDNLAKFISFTHDIQQVKRAMLIKGEENYENDSEHSFQLAITALYVIEINKLPLNVSRVMAMAVVHDVIEVYSGDTPVYGSEALLASKAQREAVAIQKLKDQWPELELMHELIDECEAKATRESKFIYALDKLVPMLNNYLDNGRTWRRHKVTFDQMLKVKAGKVDIDPTVGQYYQQILVFYREHPEFFAS